MFDKLNLVALAKGRMDWVARRQEVLAENIANANTPKYVPSDVKPFKETLGETLLPVQPVATDPRHISTQIRDPRVVAKTKKTFESSPDGNGVVLDEQLAKMSDARTQYDVAASLFQKQFKLIRMSLGKGY
ncbi:MAG: flagellar basal body protein [Solirubrobacterales bacterium]